MIGTKSCTLWSRMHFHTHGVNFGKGRNPARKRPYIRYRYIFQYFQALLTATFSLLLNLAFHDRHHRKLVAHISWNVMHIVTSVLRCTEKSYRLVLICGWTPYIEHNCNKPSHLCWRLRRHFIIIAGQLWRQDSERNPNMGTDLKKGSEE